MALQIFKATSTSVGGMIADRRLCLTSDQSRVVEADDTAAGYLLAPPGTEIPAHAVARYRLTVVDGKVALPKTAEPAKTIELVKPKKKGADV
jgi:hypothetical protein